MFALDLAFLISLAALAISAIGKIVRLSNSSNKWFYLIQFVGVLGARGTPVAIYNAMLAHMDE